MGDTAQLTGEDTRNNSGMWSQEPTIKVWAISIWNYLYSISPVAGCECMAGLHKMGGWPPFPTRQNLVVKPLCRGISCKIWNWNYIYPKIWVESGWTVTEHSNIIYKISYLICHIISHNSIVWTLPPLCLDFEKLLVHNCHCWQMQPANSNQLASACTKVPSNKLGQSGQCSTITNVLNT